MQKRFSFIPILIAFYSATHALALDAQKLLSQADSLFQKKKFAESSELYFKLYQQGHASQATLLKMAFVHEGLGQMGHALFFLNAYYNLSEDSKAYDKIQTLANARNLSGYDLSDFERASVWIANRADIFSSVLVAASILALALIIFSKQKRFVNAQRIAWGFLLLITCVLLVVVNFASPSPKAVIAKPTYFMSGPSAGASFMGMVSDGNQVSVAGGEDVWARVVWNGKDGFIKKNDLLVYQ
jgi:hypothetical protein